MTLWALRWVGNSSLRDVDLNVGQLETFPIFPMFFLDPRDESSGVFGLRLRMDSWGSF